MTNADIQHAKFQQLKSEKAIFDAAKFWIHLSSDELENAFMRRITDVELLIAATTGWEFEITQEMCEQRIRTLNLKDELLFDALNNMPVSQAFKEEMLSNLSDEWLVAAITEWFND